MYYKITNIDSVVYQKLHTLRSQELQFEKDNVVAIEQKTGMTFKQVYGDLSQQNFRRVPQYSGFVFDQDVKTVDPKMVIWKPLKQDPTVSIPNPRTKLGREMREFLCNGLKGGRYDNVFTALGIEMNFRSFSFPYVEILADQSIVVYLDDKLDPKIKDLIEITRSEFKERCKASKDIEIDNEDK